MKKFSRLEKTIEYRGKKANVEIRLNTHADMFNSKKITHEIYLRPLDNDLLELTGHLNSINLKYDDNILHTLKKVEKRWKKAVNFLLYEEKADFFTELTKIGFTEIY